MTDTHDSILIYSVCIVNIWGLWTLKKYSQPSAGTKDALTLQPSKLVNKKSNPSYEQRQNQLEWMSHFYKGNTNNYEWQV